MHGKKIFAAMMLLAFNCNAEQMLTGVAVHPINFHDTPEKMVSLLDEYNVESIRADYPWRSVEKKRGVYTPGNKRLEAVISQAASRGIKPLLILDYGNPLYENISPWNPQGKPTSDATITAFSKYAEWTTRHFGNKVDTYEVWNEWIQGAGKRNKKEALGENSAKTYAKLVVETCNAIKKVDSSKKVIIGSTSPSDPDELKWLVNVLRYDGVMPCIDGLSLHIYNFSLNKSLNARNPVVKLILLQRYLTDQLNLQKEMPFYVTEIGAPSVENAFYSKEDTRVYFEEVMKGFNELSYVKGVWWYDFVDDGEDKMEKEHNFGVLDRSFSPKPIAESLKNVKTLLK
ncbi:TPA: hypothetical protein ACIPUI_001195 [Citrobacter freundii]